MFITVICVTDQDTHKELSCTQKYNGFLEKQNSTIELQATFMLEHCFYMKEE